LRKLSIYFGKVDVTSSKLCKNPEEELVLLRMEEQGNRSFAEFLVRKDKAQEQVLVSKGMIGILGTLKESGMKDFKRKTMQSLCKNLGRNNGRDNLSFLLWMGRILARFGLLSLLSFKKEISSYLMTLELGHGFRAGSDDLVGKAKRDEKALGNKGMGFKDLGWKEVGFDL
jgi:hypothetical protein